MYSDRPYTPEDLIEWREIAIRRKAILPVRIVFRGRQATITCDCSHVFTRKLLPNRNDPVCVCPSCGSRNYIPVEW